MKRYTLIGPHLASALCSLFIAGCSAGTGEGLDQNGQPITEDGGGNVPLAPTYYAIQRNIFDAHCIVCHAGGSAPLGLRLDSANAYGMLVDVDSAEVSSLKRVAPSDPDNSYLIHKLEGTMAAGGQMPLGTTPLPSATIDMVRQWITEGAQNNGAPTDNGGGNSEPPRVNATSPEQNASLTALPSSISVIFSGSMDASRVTTQSLTLERSGGDGGFNEGNEVSVVASGVSLSSSNASLATMNLSGVTSVDDDYRLTVTGSGDHALMDLAGQALDGDADGVAGGDYHTVFSVNTPATPPPDGQTSAWQVIQESVLTPVCTVCHSGASAPEGLRLDAANSYAMLVGVASSEVPGLQRVNPGDPDNSYLIQKLEGTAAQGGRMPLGGAALPQATIDYIRQWIADGASQTGGGDGDGGDNPPPPPPPDPLEPTWRSIQDRVFSAICTACHIGDTAPEDLELDEANSYAMLVGVTSGEDSSFLRVAPGDAENSYLVMVLEGRADTPQMPFELPPLPQETIDVIRRWIDEGAAP